MSRTTKSLQNIKVILLLQTVSSAASFFTRRVFVQMLSQEYLGLNGTFSNILAMLSLAEMGIGSVFTYNLYKPLAEQDKGQIAALMVLFRRTYRTIGLVIAALGCALTPFLPVLIRDMPDIPHIYLIYLMFVLDTSLSYFYVYKQLLIIADQRRYIVSTCSVILNMLLQLGQIFSLRLTGNYFAYLGLQVGKTLLTNIILSRIADRLYPYLKIKKTATLSQDTKQEIIKNTKARILHKIGSVVVFGTDNMLISYFVGVISVGLYSNYLMVSQTLAAVYGQLFEALTASIGNLGATSRREHTLPVFWQLNFVVNWLYGFSAVCLFILFNPFISIWLGDGYLFSQEIVFLIALNFYVTGMRQAVQTFRDAYGLFWHDRYKPIAESVINLVVSAVLAIPFGTAGILLGTFVSTMTVCFWVEPLVLFRHGFRAPVWPYFREYALNTLLTLVTGAAAWWVCKALPGEGLLLFLAKMAVCATGGNLFYLLVYHRREEFRYFVELFSGLLRRKNSGTGSAY